MMSSENDHAAAPARPSLRALAAASFKIGCLGFGGPAGQIALMHRIFVEEKKWIDEPRYLHALNYCMLLPGPEAQQLATYVGWLLHGIRGGVIAGALFVLPGALVVFALSWLYAVHGAAPLVIALFYGVKAAVLAFVVEALVKVGKRALKTPLDFSIALRPSRRSSSSMRLSRLWSSPLVSLDCCARGSLRPPRLTSFPPNPPLGARSARRRYGECSGWPRLRSR